MEYSPFDALTSAICSKGNISKLWVE